MKKLLGLLLLVAVLFVGTMSVSAASGKNAAFNSVNGGYAVSDGEYVYYSADGHLYREDVGGGNRKSLLDGNSYEGLTVYDDYIYYKPGISNSIYRINLNGQEAEEYVAAGDCYEIYNGDIYVSDPGYYNIKIIKYEIGDWDNGIKILEQANRSGFAILDKRIYFDNDNSDLGSEGLASVDLNGNDFKSHMIGTVKWILGAYDDKIYFQQDGAIKCMTKSGREEEIEEIQSLVYPVIYNDYIYFRDYQNGDYVLARIPVNGGEKEVSELEIYDNLCIVEDVVYSRSPSGYETVMVKKLPKFKSLKDEDDNSNNVSSSSLPFSNVSDWAKEEVGEAYETGLVPEYFEGKDLTQRISRAEFAAVAVRAYEVIANKVVSAKSTPFDDISRHVLKSDIGKAYGLNVAIGVSDDEFEPDTDINREQLATMLCRVIKKYKFPEWNMSVDDEYHMSGSNAKKFADDGDISDYAKDSVYFMSSVGIIKGVGDNKFAPKNTTSRHEAIGYATATREQAIVMANRIHKIADYL